MREVLVRLVFGEHLVRPLHPRQPFVEPAGLPIDLGQTRGHAGGRVSLAGLLEQVEGAPVAILRLGLARAGQGHFARAFEQTRLVQRVVGELGGLLEVALGLLCGGERCRALGRPGEQLLRLLPDLPASGASGAAS